LRHLLIDTNVLIWSADNNLLHNVGKKAQKIIESSRVYISSVSSVEIVIKNMTGKLKVVDIDSKQIALMNAEELPFTSNHAVTMNDFVSLTKHDQFDRMLLAQAKSEGMMFLTADKILLGLGLDFVVDASV